MGGILGQNTSSTGNPVSDVFAPCINLYLTSGPKWALPKQFFALSKNRKEYGLAFPNCSIAQLLGEELVAGQDEHRDADRQHCVLKSVVTPKAIQDHYQSHREAHCIP